MEKKVYLLCPECNGITKGIGSGEITNDPIWCEKCKTATKANRVGIVSRYLEDEDPRPFYIETAKATTYWD